MSATNNRNNNSNKSQSSFAIAISMLLNKMKKYLAIWIAAAILIGVLTLIYSLITTQINKPELKAIIGFSYDGIDKGLDPNGRKFDINTVKSPAVIEMALTELGMDMMKLEDIRNGISFEDVIPSNAYDKYTIYNSILEKGGGNSLDAGEKLLDTSYSPTRFTVLFDYNKAGFSSKEAANVFNTILKKYDDYFYKTYGYNEALGNAVSAISYNDYDYAEAVDVFSNSLGILRRYVKQLSDEDDARFRSTATGYTFADLYSSISTVMSIDLDTVSSYINRNNVTKNRDKAITYTEYRIDALTRQQAQYEERLGTYDKSIDKYEKDQVLVFGGAEDINTQSNIASAQYDKMFSQQNSVADELAETKQQIEYYKKRLSALKSSSLNSKGDIEEVETSLASLNEKVNNLIELTCNTAEDYYKNVTFGNAYNILVPASVSTINKIKIIFENMKIPFVVLEAIAFFIYFSAAYITAFLGAKNNDSAVSASSGESKKKSDKE